ncbi:MAG: FkbM family methyltransferase [Stappiaceae bacterium]
MTVAQAIDTTSPFGTYQAGTLDRLAWRIAEKRSISFGLRKSLRRLAGYLFSGPFDAEVEGIRFRIYPADNYDDRKIIARERLPEREEHRLLAGYLKPGTVFADIGANIGSYTLFAAGKGATVVAIEANPATAEKLSFNIAANELEKVTVINTAVGEKEGSLQLWSVDTNIGFATLVPALTTGKWKGNWTSKSVPVRPLKSVLSGEKIIKIDVMKLDVEGFEDKVLLPYLAALDQNNWPDVILIETNCKDVWDTDAVRFLEEHGYGRTGQTLDNMLFVKQ